MGGQGSVGEQGGVDGRLGNGYAKVFFRPTPSWLSPGRLTRSMALQKQ